MAKKKPGVQTALKNVQEKKPVPSAGKETAPGILQKAIQNIPFQIFLLATVSLFLRWNLIDIPLERDEGAYAVLGKMAMEGLVPYRDFYEMKPPFIFYAYGLLVKLFGFSHAGLHWAAWVLCLMNIISVYFIAGLCFGSGFRFWGGLVFTLLLSNPYTASVFLESELVVLALALPGLLALMRVLFNAQGRMGHRAEAVHLFFSGLLIMSSVWVKQTGVYFLGFAIAIAFLNLLFQGADRAYKLFLIRAGWFLSGLLAVVLIGVVIIQAFGVWKEFWFWNVEYIKMYASTITGELARSAFISGFTTVSRYFQAYWIAAMLGFLALWASGLTWEKKLALFFLAVFSFAAVAPGRRFYHHYWLLFLPAVALLITALVYSIQNWLNKVLSNNTSRILTFSLAGLFLIVPVMRYSFYWSNPNFGRILRDMFPGNPYMENRVLADLLEKRIQPGEEIAVLGSETPYYVYLNREPLTRHFYAAFLMRPTQYAESWQQEALDDIISRKPEYAVFNFISYSWMQKPDSRKILYNGAYRWCMDEYEPIAWVFYRNMNQPEIILDPVAAKQYSPLKDGTPFIMLMQRKKALPPQ